MSLADKLHKTGVKVAVLCGGPGAEREVSLASGDLVHSTLVEAGLPNRKMEIPAEGYVECLESLDCQIAVMMLHGEWGEDGEAQKILERRGIAYSGSDSHTSALAMNKDACKRIFAAKGIPTAPWVVGSTAEELDAKVRESAIRFPVFVKPNFRGSSVGASRVDDIGSLAAAVEYALTEDHLIMAEEMIVGRELTVGWLDGMVLPVIEMVADGVFYDYKAKYQSDETRYHCPAELTPAMNVEVKTYAERVTEAIGVRDLARVDMMLGVNGPMVLEVNTLPGFTSHSLLPMAAANAGIGIREVCLRLVEMTAQRAGLI